MKFDFDFGIEDIREVSVNRKYWFIRTYSGELFQHFLEEEYVGLGFNNVPLEYIKKAKPDNDHSKQDLKEFIENNTIYEKGEATKWANQLINFEKVVKVGDIVIIPSKGSSHLAIGEITSSLYLVNETRTFPLNQGFERYPEKRRKVDWKIMRPRPFFRNDLNGIFNSRQAISPVDEIGNTIESFLSKIFIKEGKTYLTITVNQNEDINAFHFRDFLDSLTYFYSEICKELDPENDGDHLYIKIKVQSKGKVALIALSVVGLLSLGFITMIAQNPEIKIELGKYKLDAKSDGLLPAISDFLDRTQERKIQYDKYQRSIQNLQIEGEQETGLTENIRDDEEE